MGSEHIVARMHTHILLLLVSLSCLCSRTYSIKCYQCDTYDVTHCDDPWVNEPVRNSHLLDCDQIGNEMQHEYVCRKITQTVEGLDKIIRSCAQVTNMDQSSDSCSESQGTGYYKKVCDCHTEACNSAAWSTVSLLLAMTSCLLISQLS